MERFGRCRVEVLGKESVVDHADDFACFFGDLQLAVEVGVARLHEESEAVVLLVEVLEEDDLWLAIGLLHVIDIPRTEIADHNPTRALGVWEFGSIAFGLLERREQRAIGLRDGLAEVDMAAFLLNEHLGRRDIAVNKAGVAEFDLPFEGDEVADVLDAEDIGEQVEPELLAFAFLVTAVGPVGLKLQRCAILLGLVHGGKICYGCKGSEIFWIEQDFGDFS